MTDRAIPAAATEVIARIGLAARALVYFAVAIVLADGAFSAKAENGASPGDAFRAIEHQLGGRILLVCLAAGLFLYALWRFQQATFDPEHHGNSAKGIFARLGMASSGMSYLLIGIAAFAVTLGTNDPDGGGKTETTARWLIEQPYGRWLVALGGLALIGIGGAQIWRGRSQQWKNRIDLSGWANRLTRPIAVAIAGRGMLFMLVGAFLLVGGAEADKSDVRGLAATLGWLHQQPYGLVLFLGSATAIGVYGMYSGVQALRYKFPDS